MTQAFNLSQLGNRVNVTGQLDASTGLVNITPVANGGTGRSTLTANNVLLGNGTTAVQQIAPGASGNILQSNGTTWASTALALIPQIQQQTLTVGSSTWSKPTTGGYQWLWIQMWAGGGSGGRTSTFGSGGGGGAYNEIIVPLSYLAASESYTVGAGGTAITGTAQGNAGGNTSFTLTNYPGGAKTQIIYGGGGGTQTPSTSLYTGGGGGWFGAGGGGAVRGGGRGAPSINGAAVLNIIQDQITAGGDGPASSGNGISAGNSVYGGGGGAPVGTTSFAGSSMWGGGGGGSRNGATNYAPGTSVYGGNGGTAAAVGGAGVTPSGGGAGGTTSSGAGGNGQIILTWW